MALQFSTTLRNARADQLESTIGTLPTIELRSGAVEANCAAADSGTLLATVALPSDWLAAASGGVKAASGLPWTFTGAAGAGSGTAAAHFRLKSSGGTVHMQGTVTATGGGGDMTLDNTNIANGQNGSITTFQFTEAGA